MDRRSNPYAPGAGLQPPELAGRDRLLQEAAIDLDRVMLRRPAKGMMLLGLRGAGKTVLLNRLHGARPSKRVPVRPRLRPPKVACCPSSWSRNCARFSTASI